MTIFPGRSRRLSWLSRLKLYFALTRRGKGGLEGWSAGELERCWKPHHSKDRVTPSLHHSITPLLHYSITPLLHYSNAFTAPQTPACLPIPFARNIRHSNSPGESSRV